MPSNPEAPSGAPERKQSVLNSERKVAVLDSRKAPSPASKRKLGSKFSAFAHLFKKSRKTCQLCAAVFTRSHKCELQAVAEEQKPHVVFKRLTGFPAFQKHFAEKWADNKIVESSSSGTIRKSEIGNTAGTDSM